MNFHLKKKTIKDDWFNMLPTISEFGLIWDIYFHEIDKLEYIY